MVPRSWLSYGQDSKWLVCYPMDMSPRRVKKKIKQCEAHDGTKAGAGFRYFKCIVRYSDGEISE